MKKTVHGKKVYTNDEDIYLVTGFWASVQNPGMVDCIQVADGAVVVTEFTPDEVDTLADSIRTQADKAREAAKKAGK